MRFDLGEGVIDMSDLDDFLEELDSGEFREERSRLISQYVDCAESASLPKIAAAIGIEFADRLSMQMFQQYAKWIKRRP